MYTMQLMFAVKFRDCHMYYRFPRAVLVTCERGRHMGIKDRAPPFLPFRHCLHT